MFKTKKIFGGAMCLILSFSLISMFSGCKNDDKKTAGKDGYRTLSIMGQVDQEFWDSRDNQPVWKKFEEMLDKAKIKLEIEAITQEQYQTTLQTRLATGADLPDLVNLETMDKTTSIKLGQQGMILDILPLVKQYSDGTIDKSVNERLGGLWGTAVTEDNKAYWLPFGITIKFNDGANFNSPMVPVIREDWVKKLDLQMPTTIDEYKKVLRDFREKDANGNGKKDEVMIVFTKDANPFEMFGPLFGMPCEHVLVDTTDDTVKSPWLMKDNLVSFFEFFQEMTKEGILSKDAINQSAEYVLQQTKLNRVSSKNGFALTNMYDGEVSEFGGAYRGVFPAAVSEEQLYIQAAPPTSETRRLAITKACKDKEAAIDFMDLLHSDEFTVLTSAGVEGISYDVVDGTVVNKVYDDGLVFGSREYWLKGRIRGGELWLGLLGGVQQATGEDNVNGLKDYPYLVEVGQKYAKGNTGYKYYYPGTYELATASTKEAERETAIWNDLKTYMDETALKLAIGEYKLSDIDKYINQMKEMGLEEMIQIRQQQHNRYIGK